MIRFTLKPNCIVKHTGKWRKVAAIVGEAMIDDISNIKNIPDDYLADRIYKLANAGVLEYQGVLGSMRCCEVKLSSTN